MVVVKYVATYTKGTLKKKKDQRRTYQMMLFITKTCLYSNILKILQPKKENFQIKNSDNFHIPAQNIDCGYSLELPQ